MRYEAKDATNAVQQFSLSRLSLSKYSMEIIGEANELSPLTMLRHYEADSSVDNSAEIASAMLAGKEVRFYDGKVEVFRAIVDKSGDLNTPFATKPFLLDICLKYCYALMLKKLTAPSPDSETSTEQSETTEQQ